jgi:hypothetical protein
LLGPPHDAEAAFAERFTQLVWTDDVADLLFGGECPRPFVTERRSAQEFARAVVRRDQLEHRRSKLRLVARRLVTYARRSRAGLLERLLEDRFSRGERRSWFM